VLAAAIKVRENWTAGELRRAARGCGDSDQVRRLLAIALTLDGASSRRLDAEMTSFPPSTILTLCPSICTTPACLT